MDMSSLKHASILRSPSPQSFMLDYTSMVSAKGNTDRRLILAETENRTLKAENALSRKLIEESTLAITDLKARLSTSARAASDCEDRLQKALEQVDKLQAAAAASGRAEQTGGRGRSTSRSKGERADSGCGLSDEDEKAVRQKFGQRSAEVRRPKLGARAHTEA